MRCAELLNLLNAGSVSVWCSVRCKSFPGSSFIHVSLVKEAGEEDKVRKVH